MSNKKWEKLLGLEAIILGIIALFVCSGLAWYYEIPAFVAGKIMLIQIVKGVYILTISKLILWQHQFKEVLNDTGMAKTKRTGLSSADTK